jgi:2-polyprenyl-3-methyl-5-hydroxy-6-metoxy-1,4-benzoquinol methylase
MQKFNEIKFNPEITKQVDNLYKTTPEYFNELFGRKPNPNISDQFADTWRMANPQTPQEITRFYNEQFCVTEELAQWHNRYPGRRRRALQASSIAQQFGCKTFVSVGCGIGTDEFALKMTGLSEKYIGDISYSNIDFINSRSAKIGIPMNVIDLNIFSKERARKDFGEADLLFSCDMLEHLDRPDLYLKNWVEQFKVAVVYAPFNIDDNQPQHTKYTSRQFHKFMAQIGFEKIKYNVIFPPYVYINKNI